MIVSKSAMKKIIRLVLVLGVVAAAGLLVTGLLLGGNVDILNPKGVIADQQRNLLVFVLCLSLVVVIPVFALLGFISLKYRESNKKAKYTPDWDHNKWLETIWWGIPCVIILILATVTWFTSHSLDPYKPLESDKQPVNVQVVALQWKWLFIYPDYGVASVNELPIPNQTPINFTITADAPMNSFWIPSLGGQIYAMSGMSTKLHLQADKEGTYKGSSANISGQGFADMRFNAVAMSQSKFDDWVARARSSDRSLAQSQYEQLALPDKSPVIYYRLDDKELYDSIVMKYMGPMSDHNHGGTYETPSSMESMHHEMGDMK